MKRPEEKRGEEVHMEEFAFAFHRSGGKKKKEKKKKRERAMNE